MAPERIVDYEPKRRPPGTTMTYDEWSEIYCYHCESFDGYDSENDLDFLTRQLTAREYLEIVFLCEGKLTPEGRRRFLGEEI